MNLLQSLRTGSYTSRAEIEARLENLRKGMEEQGFGFALILQNTDLFYFTGTIQKSVLIVPVDKPPIFCVEKGLWRASQESPLEITPVKNDREVGRILSSGNLVKGKCGMELDVVPVLLFERWKSILEFDAVGDITPLIKQLRLIKSEFEIEQVLKSGDIVDHIFQKAKEIVREGIREIDVGAFLEGEGRRYGHHGLLRMRGFNQEMPNTHVTQGYGPTVPPGADVPIGGIGTSHAVAQGASFDVVKKGTPLLIDYGGGYGGYITDETRAYVVGELDEIFRKPNEVAREIVEETIGFAREGVDATEIFLRARDRVKEAGLEEYFMGHGEGQVGFLGHGLGLEINELPVLTPRHKMTLREGMVFAMEPKFVFPEIGTIGIEVDFIVRKDGIQRVTNTPLDVVYV